jgi:glycosyltransferase involved in cell wall biosynthesis
VVATDIRGCRQVVEPGVTGLLVPPRSPAELADAICTLVSDAELRTSYGVAACQKAQGEFDQAMQIRVTLSVYEALLRCAE